MSNNMKLDIVALRSAARAVVQTILDEERNNSIPKYAMGVKQLTPISTPKGIKLNKEPYMVPSADGGYKPLVVEKTCLASYIGLKQPEYELFSVADELMSKLLLAHWDTNDVVPFGSGLKPDSKKNSKAYLYDTRTAQQIFGNQASDIAAYGSKLFTDVKYIDHIKVLVIDYDELVARIGDTGIDGSAYFRPGIIPRGKNGLHAQFVAVPESILSRIPIAKGGADEERFTDQEFSDFFGDVDAVFITQDVIKCNYDKANTGWWIVGYTWNEELKNAKLPIMWEFTQFLKQSDEIYLYLEQSMLKAIDSLIDCFKSREGILDFIDKRIRTGSEVEANSKLILALTSDLPWNIQAIKSQLVDLMISSLYRIIKSYGVEGDRQHCWTDNVLWETNPRYISKQTAKQIGGDNDFDMLGRFVNNELGIVVYFRYPIVGRFAIVNMPDSLRNTMADCHPELVSLIQKYYDGTEFDRNMIKDGTKPLNMPLYYARKLAHTIATDPGIGANTILTYRGQRMWQKTGEAFWKTECVFSSQWNTEKSAVGLKKTGVKAKSFKMPEGIDLAEEFPMQYRSWMPKSIEHFDVDFGRTEMDAKLYSIGASHTFHRLQELKSMDICPLNEIYIPQTATIISKGFMDRVRVAIDFYNQTIKAAIKLPDSERKELIATACKALSILGEQMSVDELKSAIQEAFQNASELATGAFGIHLAGARMHDVFGSCYRNVTPKVHDRLQDIAVLKCYTNSDLPDTLPLTSDSFVYDYKSLTITIGKLHLKLNKNATNNGKNTPLPLSIKEISAITPYVTHKDGVREVSKRSLWITVKL